MTENQPSQEQSAVSSPDVEKGQAPYESAVSQVVTKIKNEPFLFVIAVAALLIGLTVLAVGLGSPDLRFIVVVALLAFVVIVGYYFLAAFQMRAKMQREAWKHEERLRKADQAQSPAAAEAKPAAAEGTTDAPTPADAPKYDIHMPGATGVAIGDGAKVEQRFGSPGLSLTPGAPPVGALMPEEQRAALEQELAQHQRDLIRLQAKKGVYAAGEEPLSLVNQIESEEREIQRLQAELAKLAGGASQT